MHFSKGNHKIGKDTLIFNMSSATDCPSRKLGLCQLTDCKKCYALKAERQYPTVLPYRRRQERSWKAESYIDMSAQIKLIVNRARIAKKYVRYSESGDFRNQCDVKKLIRLAESTPEIQFYGHTARRDLNLKHNLPNLAINGSGFMADNEFRAVKVYSKNAIKCAGNCRICDLCKTGKGLTIENLLH